MRFSRRRGAASEGCRYSRARREACRFQSWGCYVIGLFGSSEVGAIMGGCDTQTLAEHDAHPVYRAESAVIGDGFERPVATLSSVQAASIRARSTNSCGVIPVSLTKCRARLRVLIPTTSASD